MYLCLNLYPSSTIARSTYFYSMFGGGFQENGVNIVEIDNVELDVFKATLKFIYTLDVGNILRINLVDLLKAADMVHN